LEKDVTAMKRWHLLVGLGGALLGLLICGLAIPNWSPDEPPVFADAPPSRGAIARAVGKGPLVPGSPRASLFGTMLTQRYRGQNYAVRVIVRPAGYIELRCGANMTHRQMATVVAQVQGDARAVINRNVDIDLYATYMVGPHRKIGEMRQAPDGEMVLRFGTFDGSGAEE